MTHLAKTTTASPSRKAALFKNGANQAVRLPQEFRFAEGVREVAIQREGERLVLTPISPKGDWATFFAAGTAGVPDDFMADRDRSPSQTRDWP